MPLEEALHSRDLQLFVVFLVHQFNMTTSCVLSSSVGAPGLGAQPRRPAVPSRRDALRPLAAQPEKSQGFSFRPERDER